MMKNNAEFEQEILIRLVKKYYERELKRDSLKVSRRIILKVTEIYCDYQKLNADIMIKNQINDVVKKLEDLDFIKSVRLKFSDDIEKVHLNEVRVNELETYMNTKFGISTRFYLTTQVEQLINYYRGKGKLTDFYCLGLNEIILKSAVAIDLIKESEILEMLAFLQDNDKELYVREVSMLVYGKSKHFETYRLDIICNIIKEAFNEEHFESTSESEILRKFHIHFPEQNITLKGSYLIEFDDCTIQTKYFTGGLTFSEKDISRMRRIVVNTANLLTIENRTAFLRFNDENYSTIYLGGFANHSQILFITRLFKDNPDIGYFHFGDIDIGGLFIHQHLCMASGIAFKMFRMGINELNDCRFKNCHIALSPSDLERIDVLQKNSLYNDIISEMLNKNAKLEQEIVCLMLDSED